MAKLQDANLGISENVPSASTPLSRQFGRTGEAIEGLGTDIEQQATTLQENLVHLQAIDSSSAALARSRLDSDNKITQLKLQSPDGFIHQDVNDPASPIVKDDAGNPRTITQEYRDWADEHYRNMQEDMPTGVATEMYRQRALPMFGESIAEVGHASMEMRVKASQEVQAQNLQMHGDALVTAPDMLHLYRAYDDLYRENQQRVGLSYNATEAEAMTRQGYNKLGRDIMQGAYTQILAQKKEGDPSRIDDINRWRTILAGNDQFSRARQKFGQATLANSMDPQQKSVEEEKLVRLIPTALAMDKSDLMTRLKANSTALQNGNSDPQALQYSVDELNNLVTAGHMHGSQAVEIFAGLASDQEVGRYMGRDSSPWDAKPKASRLQDVQSAVGRATSFAQEQALRLNVPAAGDLGKIAGQQTQDAMMAQVNRVEAEKSQDMAAFSQRVTGAGQKIGALDFTSIPGLAKHAKDLQAAAGAQEVLTHANPPASPLDVRGPVTKIQSAVIADQLSNPNGLNERLAASSVFALQKAYGPYTGKVMSQMIQDHNLDPKWQIALLHANDHDQVAMTAVVAALRGSPATDKMFKDLSDSKGAQSNESDLRDSVTKYFRPYIESQNSAYPLGAAREQFNASIVGAGETYAKKLWISNPDMGVENAAKTAYQQMIGGQVHTGSVGGKGWFTGSQSSRRGPYQVPLNIDGRQLGDADFANIKENLTKWATPEALTKYNPVVPTQANGQASIQADKWLPMVVQNSHPVYSPKDKAFMLMYTNGGSTDGVYSPERAVTHMDGKGHEVPILLPLHDALRTPNSAGSVMDHIEKLMTPALNAPKAPNSTPKAPPGGVKW